MKQTSEPYPIRLEMCGLQSGETPVVKVVYEIKPGDEWADWLRRLLDLGGEVVSEERVGADGTQHVDVKFK